MLPNERIMAAIKGLPTDEVPYQEIFFGHRGFAEHFGGTQDSAEAAARYLFNSGQCSYLVGGFWWGAGEQGEVEGGEHRYAGGNMLTMKDVEAMQPPRVFEESILRLEESIAAARKYNLATHVFLMNSFHSCATTIGLENFCYAMFDAPEVIHAYMDKIEQYNRDTLMRLRDFDIDFVFFDGDCAYKNGLMISPTDFRSFWFERTKKTLEVCQENGWPYCFHTDGKIDEVYPMLIELGFSATHGVEAACNNLADIKERFGDKITLIGNFDIVDLAFKTPAQIISMTKDMLEIGSKGGRYMAACNTMAKDDIPLENYLAFRDTIVNFNTK